jgi:hypothetical protein
MISYGQTPDIVSPLVPAHRFEAKRRVLDPCLEWMISGWMGFNLGEHSINNWNP